MACDDHVLRRVASPLDYAQCLKRVAEKSLLRKQIVLAQAIVSRVRQVTWRVTHILDSNRNRWRMQQGIMNQAVVHSFFHASAMLVADWNRQP